jgi:hypothetical protein
MFGQLGGNLVWLRGDKHTHTERERERCPSITVVVAQNAPER